VDKDEDDIPLGRLLRGRRPSLHLAKSRPETSEHVEEDGPSSGSSGFSPEVSPFPLNVSPFVPTSATDAGEDTAEDHDLEHKQRQEHISSEDDIVGEDDSDHLLASPDEGQSHKNRTSLFAKNSSGGHRWCSKCDTWKPDRCHHCRYCKRCTLKSES
jgi:hypothetical protein